MRHVFKFRLYPTEEQEKQMLEWVEACKKLWNKALNDRTSRWENSRQSTTYHQQSCLLTEARKNNRYLNALYSQVGQDVLRRLDKAYKAFFKGVSGYPKFKKLCETGSFSYPQAYANSSVRLYKKMLRLSKIGFISIVIHRDVPTDTKMKTCTIKHLADGTWYAMLVYEDEKVLPLPQTTFIAPVGIDLGLKSVITTTNGLKVEPLKALHGSEKRLKHLQRMLSRKKKGSKNRIKARVKVARVHSKIARQRMDFNHKLSTNLVQHHDLVVFEDLNINNMITNHTLAKSIQDTAWNQLKTFVKYKELKTGGMMLEVPAPNTTQNCSSCGTKNEVTLEMREFKCLGCGHTMDRDLNAANNILKRGLAAVGQVMPKLKPVERMAPPIRPSVGLVPDLHEAGTCPSGEPHANH